jgi:hypothetical protein
MIFYEMVQRKLEGTRLDLLGKIDHNHRILVVVARLELGHVITP